MTDPYDLIESCCLRGPLGIEIRYSPSGWTINDAGQRCVSGGKWMDRTEGIKSGTRVVADYFPTLLDALQFVVEKMK